MLEKIIFDVNFLKYKYCWLFYINNSTLFNKCLFYYNVFLLGLHYLWLLTNTLCAFATLPIRFIYYLQKNIKRVNKIVTNICKSQQKCIRIYRWVNKPAERSASSRPLPRCTLRMGPRFEVLAVKPCLYRWKYFLETFI